MLPIGIPCLQPESSKRAPHHRLIMFRERCIQGRHRTLYSWPFPAHCSVDEVHDDIFVGMFIKSERNVSLALIYMKAMEVTGASARNNMNR